MANQISVSKLVLALTSAASELKNMLEDEKTLGSERVLLILACQPIIEVCKEEISRTIHKAKEEDPEGVEEAIKAVAEESGEDPDSVRQAFEEA